MNDSISDVLSRSLNEVRGYWSMSFYEGIEDDGIEGYKEAIGIYERMVSQCNDFDGLVGFLYLLGENSLHGLSDMPEYASETERFHDGVRAASDNLGIEIIGNLWMLSLSNLEVDEIKGWVPSGWF